MKKNILIITAKENMENACYLAGMLAGKNSPYYPYVLQRMEEPTGYGIFEFSNRLYRDQGPLKNSISAVVTDRDFYKNIFPMSILKAIEITDHEIIPGRVIIPKKPLIMTPFDDMGEDTVNYIREELDECFLHR